MSSSSQFYIPKDKTIKKTIKYTFVEYISGQWYVPIILLSCKLIKSKPVSLEKKSAVSFH